MNFFEKPLFTFEMANNHQGDVEHGKTIIREIKKVTEPYKDVFSFAMKFQYRDLDTFIHPDYKDRMDIKNVKRFQDTKLTCSEFLALKEEVEKQGMYTMCTAFDEASVRRIKEEGYDIIKIASCSFTDWTLLEEIALTKLPVIASGAGSSMDEVDKVVSFFRNRRIPLALMHCIAEYPTPDEHLQMNQITLYKERYPQLHIGFSTHEDPNNMEPVKVAVAKGAEIFEKHVGVETDTIKLNGYSATPAQVADWLEAAYKVFKMCGVVGERYEPLDKEKADLKALQRGVFAKRALKAGEVVSRNDIYLAFPCQPGQVLAGDLSKYIGITVGENDIAENGALYQDNVVIADNTECIQEIVHDLMMILKKSNVVVPVDSNCQLSHHYGIEKYRETGVAMIECINREYCKKILVMLPGQSHPTHMHQQKEETFSVLYGDLKLVCDGEEKDIRPGDSVVIERGKQHAFSSKEGCVFEEISTTHYDGDSYYEDRDGFVSPRKTTVYLTKEMLDNMNI